MLGHEVQPEVPIRLSHARVDSPSEHLELLRVLSPGTPVEGAIRVNGREYAYSGRVACAKPGSPRLNVRGRMGIRISSIAPEIREALEALPAPEKTPPGQQLAGSARKR